MLINTRIVDAILQTVCFKISPRLRDNTDNALENSPPPKKNRQTKICRRWGFTLGLTEEWLAHPWIQSMNLIDDDWFIWILTSLGQYAPIDRLALATAVGPLQVWSRPPVNWLTASHVRCPDSSSNVGTLRLNPTAFLSMLLYSVLPG